jgi:ubiquinone/menaquinone biosynthesis C-methylase UbiE
VPGAQRFAVLLALAPIGCGQPTPAKTHAPPTPVTTAEPTTQTPDEPASAPSSRSKTPPPPKDEENVAPEVNRGYSEDTKIERWVTRLEDEDREVRDKQQAILEELDLKRGMVIADIGAGTGLFTIPLAKAVGDTGKVYAVEILQLFLDHIARRAAESGMSNIELVKANQKSAELPSRAIDLAFLCDTYHHIEYPKTYLSTIHAALREGGELVVIDLRRIPGKSPAWLLEHVRAGEEEIIEEIEQAGFELAAKYELLEDSYFLKFERR